MRVIKFEYFDLFKVKKIHYDLETYFVKKINLKKMQFGSLNILYSTLGFEPLKFKFLNNIFILLGVFLD